VFAVGDKNSNPQCPENYEQVSGTVLMFLKINRRELTHNDAPSYCGPHSFCPRSLDLKCATGDLNSGTISSKEIYLCFSKDPKLGQPISTITAVTGMARIALFVCVQRHTSAERFRWKSFYKIVVHTADAGETVFTECPLGFTKIDQDLNEGTLPHEDYVYLCISHEVANADISVHVFYLWVVRSFVLIVKSLSLG
jgi:hypothetical protein